jgi:hypothetical protein
MQPLQPFSSLSLLLLLLPLLLRLALALPPVRQLLQHRTLHPRPPRPRLCFLSLAFCHKSSSVRFSLPTAFAPPHLPPLTPLTFRP